ncbi:type II toxin-antitoxin system PrlF family antitoxin [Methylovirgula sp. HY1]|uniref:type II toxin-antitoxin system PrlF family antitoxin n=1 Tax=Methylovirgula sp. HY1 TaxID=2822761 RepID=UPI00351CB950
MIEALICTATHGGSRDRMAVMDLGETRVAIVTGASASIGFAITQKLISEADFKLRSQPFNVARQRALKLAPIAKSKENPYIGGNERLLMITSKLTSKAQTTIPQPVRAALHLKEGDEIAYSIEPGGRVVLSRAHPEVSADDPFATFTEWDSDADRKAYADL